MGIEVTESRNKNKRTAPASNLKAESDIPTIKEITPKNWKIVYEELREWRRNHIAPVDIMCCDKLADQHAEPEIFRFQTLVALMLSSRTRDEVTAEAMKNLHTLGTISAQRLVSMKSEVLDRCIAKVGFHRTKTRFIKATAQICLQDYGGDIPKNIGELMKLPGVGPKMAYLTLQCAWKRNSGIGVDIHVHRIANRLGWANTTSTTRTQQDLEDWLPKHLWAEVNPMLVGFGQILCGTKSPNCGLCPVANLCPSFQIPPPSRKFSSREIFIKPNAK
ncbi:alpha,alpha-trehalase nth1 [Basidiobolus ranarum]|uniref:Endonuclease III homolog n=1 Tax=Basidiobolus ranarum TaxID=34480 RepID=A0ABR2WNI4_9FUNG